MSSVYVRGLGGIGFPLVLFHGWGFDSHVWSPLIPSLQAIADVYVVDLPGFGQSELMDWEQFRTQLLTQLPDQFAVVGWSMGGGYAIQLASECPDRAVYLIGVGASPKFIREKHWPGIDGRVFDSFMLDFSEDPVKSLQSFIKTQTGKVLHVNAKRLPGIASLEAGLVRIKHLDLRPSLAQIKNGCFMFGRLDSIVPARTLATMRQCYPQFEYVLFEKDAHMPFLSNQSRFILEVQRVLGKGPGYK